MRNKFTIIRKKGDKEFEGSMSYWFSTRQKKESLMEVEIQLQKDIIYFEFYKNVTLDVK